MDVFALPDAWPLLLPVPAVAWGLWTLVRARRDERRALLDRREPVLVRDLHARSAARGVVLFSGGLFLALVAVLQPRWGESDAPIASRGVDVVVCLDVSRSMLAQDVAPDRLQAAKRAVTALVERAEGDRFALVVFAGNARLLVPLTRDRASFSELVRTAEPLSVTRGGTDLAAALELAGASVGGGLPGDADDDVAATVFLVTDGEDNQEQGLRAAGALAERGIRVHALGVGTRMGGKIPLVREDGGATSFLRDRLGVEVVTALDGASLTRIAVATGGTYSDLSTAPEPLVAAYEDHVLPLAREATETERRRERPNRYQWPLVVAFLLWILDLCRTERRSV
jgi:Ca-activated chloride channel family protein